jgi:ATP-dependent protease ClpP protease subunit
MTSIIFQAADKRIMMPHSYFLYHGGTETHSGTLKQVDSSIMQAKKDREAMLDIYVDTLKNRGQKYARWRPENIRKMLQEQMDKHEDVYLTAEQAVAAGFADGIFGGNWDNLRKHYPRKRKK